MSPSSRLSLLCPVVRLGSQLKIEKTRDPTGYGYHGDFLNGWDVDLLSSAIYDESCGDSAGGRLELCNPFKPYYQSADASNKCAGIPSVVNEQVAGVLPKLPGCNPIQPGPKNATVPSCTKH